MLDLYRPRSSPIHGADARLKLIATVGFVLLVALTPDQAWPVYIAYQTLTLSIAVLARVGTGFVLRRAWLSLPFVLAALPLLVTGPEPHWPLGVGGLEVSQDGAMRVVSIALRAWISIQAAILLTATTPMPALLTGLRQSGVPRLIVSVLELMARYLDLLVEEARRLLRARASRSAGVRPGGSLRWRAAVAGAMAGNLLLRSLDRSERVYAAMRARGYSGEPLDVKDRLAQSGPHPHVPDTRTPPGASVALDALSYLYPDGTVALNTLSLEIAAGERVGLLGVNGAGKSTLLLHLNGVLSGAGGVIIDGVPVNAATLATIRSRVGLVFQDPDDQLFCNSVYDDVAYGPRYMGLSALDVDRRVMSALTAVGLADRARRHSLRLSGGEKKRVALATVLAMDPVILALDEPSAGLDPRARRELIDLLRRLPHTLLIATHDLALAAELTTRTLILSHGTLVADGPTDRLLTDTELMRMHGLA